MAKYQVQIAETDTGKSERIESDGVIVLYLEQGKLKVVGKVEISALAPYFIQLAMQKLAK